MQEANQVVGKKVEIHENVLEGLCRAVDKSKERVQELEAERERLRSEVERYREALEEYANSENWAGFTGNSTGAHEALWIGEDDANGNANYLARRALAPEEKK